MRFEERTLIPKALKKNQDWLETIQGLRIGEISKPIPMGEMAVIIRIKEKNLQQPDHYNSVKKSVSNDVWKKKQGIYTRNLIDTLKKKYNVQIDANLLHKALIQDLSPEDLEKPLISTDRGNFPLRFLVDKINKEKNLMTRIHLNDEKLRNMRDNIVYNFLSQALINWESLDRHYENKPPLKPIFEFYKQHRLIKELENRFTQQVKVSDNDVGAYYEKNISSYTQSDIISFALVRGDTGLINKIWAAVTHGEDFFTAVRKYFFHDTPTENLSYDNIEPTVRNVLKSLTVGEVSRPFPDNDQMILVKLLGKKKATPMPLDHVKNDIIEKIKKNKFEQIRSNYLAKLKTNSAITVNENTWDSLKRKLGDKNEDN